MENKHKRMKLKEGEADSTEGEGKEDEAGVETLTTKKTFEEWRKSVEWRKAVEEKEKRSGTSSPSYRARSQSLIAIQIRPI